ncbi:hypothetical protein [Parashewanella tropica]|uniref:hypothetical protein n=1 Tax=Parashewanella tropica TaxID=2547970 RepID=UPI00105A85AC|nr:hypothetical protein [Parashewanella tropica]
MAAVNGGTLLCPEFDVSASTVLPQNNDEKMIEAFKLLNNCYDPQLRDKFAEGFLALNKAETPAELNRQAIHLNKMLYEHSELRFYVAHDRMKYKSMKDAGTEIFLVLARKHSREPVLHFPKKLQPDVQIQVMAQGQANAADTTGEPMSTFSRQLSTLSLGTVASHINELVGDPTPPPHPVYSTTEDVGSDPIQPSELDLSRFPQVDLNSLKISNEPVQQRLFSKYQNDESVTYEQALFEVMSAPMFWQKIFEHDIFQATKHQFDFIVQPSMDQLTLLQNSLEFLSFVYAVFEHEQSRIEHDITSIDAKLRTFYNEPTPVVLYPHFNPDQAVRKKTWLQGQWFNLKSQIDLVGYLMHHPEGKFESDNIENLALTLACWRKSCMQSELVPGSIEKKANAVKEQALKKQAQKSLQAHLSRTLTPAAQRFVTQNVSQHPHRSSPYSSVHSSANQTPQASPYHSPHPSRPVSPYFQN